MNRILLSLTVLFTVAVAAMATEGSSNMALQSATDLAFDMYHSCLKDFSTSCVKPKAMRWFNEALQQDQIQITDKLSIVRTGVIAAQQQQTQRAMNSQERMFQEIDNFLATHALRIKAPEYFRTAEARSLVPGFLLNNALTKGAVVPLAENQSRLRIQNFLEKQNLNLVFLLF